MKVYESCVVGGGISCHMFLTVSGSFCVRMMKDSGTEDGGRTRLSGTRAGEEPKVLVFCFINLKCFTFLLCLIA